MLTRRGFFCCGNRLIVGLRVLVDEADFGAACEVVVFGGDTQHDGAGVWIFHRIGDGAHFLAACLPVIRVVVE